MRSTSVHRTVLKRCALYACTASHRRRGIRPIWPTNASRAAHTYQSDDCHAQGQLTGRLQPLSNHFPRLVHTCADHPVRPFFFSEALDSYLHARTGQGPVVYAYALRVFMSCSCGGVNAHAAAVRLFFRAYTRPTPILLRFPRTPLPGAVEWTGGPLERGRRREGVLF